MPRTQLETSAILRGKTPRVNESAPNSGDLYRIGILVSEIKNQIDLLDERVYQFTGDLLGFEPTPAPSKDADGPDAAGWAPSILSVLINISNKLGGIHTQVNRLFVAREG